MIEKKCDVTGKTMAPQDLDFGEASNIFHTKNADGSQGELSLHVRVASGGQFHKEVHVSREGMEKLMVDAAENLPSKAAVAKVAKVPAKATKTPEPETPADPAKVAETAEKVGATLKR